MRRSSDDRRRDGFDVAYLAAAAVGGFLIVAVIALAYTGDGLDDNEQLVLVSAIGALSTIAGAALGYQVGSRAPRRSTDPGGPNDPPPSTPTPTPPIEIPEARRNEQR